MTEQEKKAMLDAMEKDEAGGRGSSFWTPEEGENLIRFLPPLKPNEEILPYFHHKVHWIDGTPYECLDQTFTDKDGNLHKAESCPACKMSKKLYKMSEKGSEEADLAYNLQAKDRYVFRIVVRGSEDETKPVFYETGPSIFKKFFSIMKSGRYGNIVHPTEGRDFIIDRKGTGRLTNYDNSMPVPDKGPIFEEKEKMKEVLTNAVAMKYSELISFPSFEEINQASKEFLDPDSSLEGSSAPPRKETTAKEETAPKKEAPAKDADDADEDQIDSLLSEFI